MWPLGYDGYDGYDGYKVALTGVLYEDFFAFTLEIP